MRHKKDKKKLGTSTAAHRVAMLRNLTTSFIEHGKMITTISRAKEMRKLAEKMVTLGKEDTVHNRRLVASFLRTNDTVVKLFKEIGPKYKDRKGGYTRIYKLGPRKGDGGFEVLVEFV